MCKLSSSSPTSCEGISDQPNLTSTLERQQNTHFSLAFKEALCIANIAFRMVLTSLLIYLHSLISVLFLGQLEELAVAGGMLAIGFANVTGYSVLSGLAMGMEPICGQAFGAKRFKLLGLTMQRAVILLLLTSIPISFLWLNMKKILLFCGQKVDIATEAQIYILYSLPDLIAKSLLHPIRIYLRSQSITLPVTLSSSFSTLLHFPIHYFLVDVLKLGIKGVALSGVLTNFILVASLIVYIKISGVYEKTWGGISLELFNGWKDLLNLAIPSGISVCLEWWWYEIMVLPCGLPRTALIYIFPSSLSFGVSTRVANELGANQPQKAKLAATVGHSFSLMLGFSALNLALMARKIWASMFTPDAEIIALMLLVLPIIGLCELGNCSQTSGRCGVFRDSVRPELGAKSNLTCFYHVGMPVAVWLSFYSGFDFKWLWLGLLAAQGSCLVTVLFLLVLADRDHQPQRASELTGSTSTAIDDDYREDEGLGDDTILDDDDREDERLDDQTGDDLPV